MQTTKIGKIKDFDQVLKSRIHADSLYNWRKRYTVIYKTILTYKGSVGGGGINIWLKIDVALT